MSTGGRPRKVRKLEFCPCCGNSGYTRRVRAWTSGYKDTTLNVYRHFRHDDRNYCCPKCGKKECYVEQILRERDKRNLPKHPLKEMITDAESLGELYDHVGKAYAKFLRAMKTWPLTIDEARRFRRSIGLVKDLWEQIAKAIDYYEIIMKDYILKGKEPPAELIDKLYSVMPAAGTKSDPDLYVRLILEPVRQEIKYLDQKYGIPQREKQKQDKIRKIKGAFDKKYNRRRRGAG